MARAGSANRSIPAWAGEPPSTTTESTRPPQVYPRVGGGTFRPRSCLYSSAAVYPRVGGGTCMAKPLAPRHCAVYPRVGGGTASTPWRQVPVTAGGLSPRGRGNPSQDTAVSSATARSHSVYPRVGGGTVGYANPAFGMLPQWFGSIPAWAGEPRSKAQASAQRARSIPAWAGEPESPCFVTVTVEPAGR